MSLAGAGLAGAALAGAALVSVFLRPTSAHADRLVSARGEPLREISHDVDAQLSDGVVTYRVRRTFANDGNDPDEARLAIELPAGAVATGLRVRAKGRWLSGTLTDDDAAPAAGIQSTAAPPPPGTPQARLYWIDNDLVGLQLSPIPAGSSRTIEYTLTAPAVVEDGRWEAPYPPGGPPRWNESLPLTVPRVKLERDRTQKDELVARFGRVPVDATEGFARLQLEVSPELSRLPRRASVVFVMDASYSADDLEAQLEMAGGYLSHVPDARVQVVLFRRGATTLFSGFVPARRFTAEVDAARKRGALEPGNGSALDLALLEATRLLKQRPGPHRLVISTDGLVRSGFSVEAASKQVLRAPDDTVAHVVEFEGYARGELQRKDAHPLAPLAVRTGGLAFELVLPEDESRVNETVLGLVRPLAIERLAYRGLEDKALWLPDTLAEGDRYDLLFRVDELPASVEVSGQLWSRPIHRQLGHEPKLDRATAALVIADAELDGRPTAELARVARFGDVVSPITSYVLGAPLARSPVGLVREHVPGLVGKGTSCGTARRAQPVRQWTRPTPLHIVLSDAVRTCVEQHPPTIESWTVKLDVETTFDEVVDVRSSGDVSAGLQHCIQEAAWALRLPPSHDKSREDHPMTFDETTVRYRHP